MRYPQLEGQKYISLTTFRRNGKGVSTPVWFVEVGGHLWVWTVSTSGKVKRLRNDPRVEFAACDVGGNPDGPYFDGLATILEDDSSAELSRAFKSKYGILFLLDRSVTKVFGKRRVFLDISPSPRNSA